MQKSTSQTFSLAFMLTAAAAFPVLAITVVQSAHAQASSRALLQGQLVNPGGAPVANALVQWSIVGTPGPGQTGATDSKGDFAFEIPLAAAGQVQLSTIANLYMPAQTSVPVQPGNTSRVRLRLTYKAAGQFGGVAGVVRNATTLQAIPNAAVSILGAGDVLSTTTDASGKFQLKPVGFNSNLTLQATTLNAPCIATTQVPLAVTSSYVTANVLAPGVLSLTVNCPPAQTAPAVEAAIRPVPLNVDDTVQWQQADTLSILSTGAPNAWNAGRVNDILRLPPGQGLLVAADEGGVWSIAEDVNRTAVPLSNKWSSVTMSSVALGTGGPADVYAGTYAYPGSEGGDLWETDTSQSQPLSNWLPVSPKPPCGSIYRILVIAEADRLVLACDTGLWWSQIPPPPSVKGTYNWAQALPAAIGSRAFSGVAKGPGWSFAGTPGTIVASRWGAGVAGLIYTGKWSGGNLVLTSTSVAASGNFSRTSVAACASNPQIMYAAAADINGQTLAGVFQSTNAGVNWIPVSLPPNPGSQGDSNQAIAVSPDCSAVALGWQTGTFVSFTGGGSWSLFADIGEYNNLHVDIHALTFDPVVPATLFIGSGGGVASAAGVINGSAPAFESDWNRELFNLEFFDGTASASFNGLVAGATQDNGVLYAGLPGPWQHVMDCAGSLECWGENALFATPTSIGSGNDVLIAEDVLAPISAGAQSIESAGGLIPFNGQTAIPVNPPCNPCVNYNLNVAVPVRFPGGFANASGQTMIAVSEMFAYWAGDGVYGLFGNNDGSGLHWELLNAGAATWSLVTGIAPTYDGSSIFVGNAIGQIFRLDAPFTGPAVQLSVNVPSSCIGFCGVTGLYAFNRNLAYATYGEHFMSWSGTSWNALGEATLPHDRPFLSIVATDPNRIYIASGAGVFDTADEGNTWSTASTGLPTLIPGTPGFQPPHFLASHDYLQLVTEPAGDTRLYLASYGRSLWTTFRPLPPPPAKRAFTSVQITLQTGNDNAEKYSEIQARLGGAVLLCLKPSNTSDPSPNGVCNNGPSATDQLGHQEWTNGLVVTQTFSLPPTILDGSAMEIDLIEHNSPPQGSDNWDIQAVVVDGLDGQGTLLLLGIENPLNGDNCLARLKASPNPTSVTYGLSANDPLGFNQQHPVPNFGPTPPGSCPQ